jgi:hypothetical protein
MSRVLRFVSGVGALVVIWILFGTVVIGLPPTPGRHGVRPFTPVWFTWWGTFGATATVMLWMVGSLNTPRSRRVGTLAALIFASMVLMGLVSAPTWQLPH